MTMQTMHASADGIIDGLRAIGFHGQLGIDQTPARRAPVLADADGKLARILSCDPEDGDEGGYALEVEIAARPIDEEVWSSTGTRIDPPWPATLGAVVAIIGRREIDLVDELLAGAENREAKRSLHWVKTDVARSHDLRCCRVGDLIAWYGDVSTITALQRLIAEQVRGRVIENARNDDSKALLQSSFWLSRAAVEEEDMILAVAGLRLAGSPHWEVVLGASGDQL